MRKTSVRKFIHMVIDILPLLIIPIFALNILHKETEPISIEVQEKVSVDFNQQLKITDWRNVSLSYNEINGGYEITNISNSTIQYPKVFNFEGGNFKYNHKYLYNFEKPTTLNFRFWSNGYAIQWNNTEPYIKTSSYQDNVIKELYLINNMAPNDTYFVPINIFDLTQMYGAGNEPTYNEFITEFSNDYYPYTESQKMLVNKPNPTTYNSTDIGSQFVYAVYKPVNDYFNFNNLFNMNAIYNWIELNLFSGTAPLPIFIIWNVIVYEFFVDLIFLLYGVFMFIIDFAEKCLERPFRR